MMLRTYNDNVAVLPPQGWTLKPVDVTRQGDYGCAKPDVKCPKLVHPAQTNSKKVGNATRSWWFFTAVVTLK